MHGKGLHQAAIIILVVAGLNFGAMTLFNWGIADALGGSGSTLTQALYILFGVAAVYEIFTHRENCKACKS